MIKPPTLGQQGFATAQIKLYGSPWQTLGGTSSIPVVSVNGSYSSVVTPGWKSMSQRQRDLAPKKPFSYVREIRTETQGFLTELRPGDNAVFTTEGYVLVNMGSSSSNWGGSGLSRTFPFPDLDSRAKALAKVQKKIAAGVTDLADADQANLAVDLAERRQCADMLKKRIGTLIHSVQAIRKGYLFEAWRYMSPKKRFPDGLKRTVRASKDNVANYWLEFQYGWKPLLSDIHGAAEQIARSYRDQVPYRFVGSAQCVKEAKDVFIQFATSTVSGNKWSELADYSYLERSKFVIEAVVDNATLQALSQTGITNPLLLAWELVPYSFVVDWFIPVGNYLEQLTYAQGLTFKTGTESKRRVGVADTRLKVFSKAWPNMSFDKSPTRHVLLTSKTRSVLTSFPYQRLPSFQPHLGVERALSGISLINQLFGRPKRTPLSTPSPRRYYVWDGSFHP